MPRTTKGGWNYYLEEGASGAGVVLFHEIFGFNRNMEEVSQALAREGISAAAVDLFRGSVAKTIEEGREMRRAVTRPMLLEAATIGVELLRQAGARQVGSMGFCMGGGMALQCACDLPLDFVVDYYGTIEKEEDIERLKGPLLLVLASEDAAVTPWAFQKLLPAAAKHQKRVAVQLYPNTRHAFHRPGGASYDPEAASDAWEKTIRFLEPFKGIPPAGL